MNILGTLGIFEKSFQCTRKLEKPSGSLINSPEKTVVKLFFITLTNFRSFISVPESVFDDQLIMA